MARLVDDDSSVVTRVATLSAGQCHTLAKSFCIRFSGNGVPNAT